MSTTSATRHAAPLAPSNVTHVVCVVDGFDRSVAALRTAVELAGEHGATLTVVYAETSVRCAVSPMGGVWIADPDELERSIEALIGEATRAVPDTRTTIAWDNAALTAVRIARDEGAEMVVAPARAGWLSRVAHGDIARQLSALAPCPVLCVAA